MMTRAESVSNRMRLRLCEKFRKWKSIFHYQFLHSKSWSNTSSLRICYDQPTDVKMLWVFIFQKDVRCAASLPSSSGWDLSCSSSTDSTTNTTTSSSTLSLGGTAAQWPRPEPIRRGDDRSRDRPASPCPTQRRTTVPDRDQQDGT